MKYEVIPHDFLTREWKTDVWAVGTFDADDCSRLVLFVGVNAKQRAEEYAKWKNEFPFTSQ